jgi:translocation and assembly module TamB
MTPAVGSPSVSRTLRRVAATLVLVSCAVFALLTGSLIALQYDPIGTWAARKVVRAIVPSDSIGIAVNHVSGTWIGSLRADGVVLTLPEGDTIAYIDTLYASYRILPLLSRTVHVERARAVAPFVLVARRADGVVGLEGWSVPEQGKPVVRARANDGWRFRLDALEVVRGAGRLVTPIDTAAASGRRSGVALELSRVNVALRDLAYGRDPEFVIDSATGRIDMPALPSEARVGPLDVRVAARLAERRLDVATLHVNGPHTRVSGAGTIALPDASGAPISTDFDLNVDSLPLALLHAALGNPPAGDAWLSARLALDGTTELLAGDIEASMSGGGTVSGSAALALETDGPVHYRADLAVASIDPALLTGDTALAGAVNGTIDVDLEGPDRMRLSGHANAVFDQFRVGPAPLRRVHLSSVWESGQAAFDLALEGDDVSADLDGTIRPFDGHPRYDARGPFRVRIAGDTADVARLAGRLAVSGTGFTPGSANADIEIALSQIDIGDVRLERGTVTASLAAGQLVWRLAARAADTGSIAANGSAVLGEDITYRIDRAVIRDFDIAAMLSDTVPSRIDAQLTASGVIGALAETRSTMSLALRDGRYGRMVIDTSAIDATLANGLLHAEGSARSTGGRVAFEIDAHPFRDVPDYEITRVTFSDVDLGALSADTALSTRITGTATGSGRGTSHEALELDLAVQLDSSRVNGQTIRSGEATLALRDARAVLHADVALADTGNVTLDVTGQPFAERPTFMIEEATFRALDPFAFTGEATGRASLNGSLTGRIDGVDPETMVAEGTLVLGESRIDRETVRHGRVAWRVRDASVEADADVTIDDGLLAAQATVAFGEPELRYVVNATLQSAHPERFAGKYSGRRSVDARLTIDGRGTDPGSMSTRIHAVADSTTFRDVRIDTLRLALLIDGGIARIDTLTIRSNVADMTGRGSMPVSDAARATRADLAIEGVIESLDPIESFLGVERSSIGTGEFQVSVTGPRDALALEATANVTALLLGETTLVGLETALTGRLDAGLVLLSATGHVELDRLNIGGNDIRLSRLDGTWDGNELAIEGDATVDDRRNVSFTVRADPRLDARRAVLERLDFSADQDRWQLVHASTVSWADGIRVDSLLMRAEDQSFAMNGVLDIDGESDVTVRMERLRIGGVADFVGYERLDGTLTASFVVQGPAAEPRITGDVDADLVADGMSSDVVATFAYDRLRLDIDARIQPDRGSPLTINGGLPVNLALTPSAEGDTSAIMSAAPGDVDLVVQADSFSVAWAEPFMDRELARGMQGLLRIDARVTGTHATPALAGSARLMQGTVAVPRLGVTYRNASLRVLLDGGVARIDSASAAAGGGTITINGTVSLPELSLGEFDIEARLDEFRAINTGAYQALASGTVALRGTTEQPRLEGNVQLVETDVHLDNIVAGAAVEPVRLTEEQIRELEEYFGIPVRAPDRDANALFDALTIDLAVSMSRDTWVRQRSNPQLAMQLTGEVQVTKQQADSVRINGRIEAVSDRSHIEQFGKRFSIVQGVVELRGRPVEAEIDVRAVYQVPSTRDPNDAEVTITLDIDGMMADLSLTLGSEPSMENADIISYLATGRPAATSLDIGGEGRSLRSISSEYALGQVTSLVENVAEQGIGLDVIEIEPDGLRGATLIAGRYVSPRVYVGFRQPIGRNVDNAEASSSAEQTEVEIEYQAVRWLLLNMEASSSAISLLFRYRHAY